MGSIINGVLPMSKKNKRLKKRLRRGRRALENMPPILCRICGESVPRGQYKKHRIEKHGASKIIMQKPAPEKKYPTGINKKSVTEYTHSNILKPWTGGATGGK